MDTSKDSGIRFDQIFLRTAHFVHREDALQLPATTQHPTSTNLLLRLQFYKGSALGRAGIGVSVSTDPNDRTLLYQFEVEMVALVTEVSGEENMPVSDYVKGPALMTLVPFIREAVANLTIRGRFGPVWLNPMNLQQFLIDSVESGVREENLPESVKEKAHA
jgi:preprotein translocase subunit SecB